ncbi:unnamed protein product [Penicillium camemberti]|uniref:Str. FM013 n=1 Tax=Penicillium camemberti (strain FM 013) TaxID=1429867 RepID=A0A0G4P271_PENC3|nr:unnamed protein product [Penicillium camemberti]
MRSRLFTEEPAQVDTAKRILSNPRGMSVLELTWPTTPKAMLQANWMQLIPGARWVVDSIILNAYATATPNIKSAQPLNVQCERGYNFGPVTLDRKRVVLSGRPDYSVWHSKSEALCLDVLIVKGKCRYGSLWILDQIDLEIQC